MTLVVYKNKMTVLHISAIPGVYMLFVVLCTINNPQPFQRKDRLYTSESDVCGRQILTSKVDSRTEKSKYPRWP